MANIWQLVLHRQIAMLFKRFSYYTVAKLAMTGAQLAFIPIAVTQLGVEGFGLFSLVLQVALLYRVLAAQAINQVVLRDYQSLAETHGEPQLYISSLAIVAFSGALLGLVAISLSSLIAPAFHLATHHVWLAVAMGAASAFFSLKHTFIYCRDLAQYTVWEVAQVVGVFVVSVIFGLLLPSIETYGIAYALVTIIVAVLMLQALNKPSFSWLAVKQMSERFWRYGIPLALADGLGWMITVADRFQIANMLDPAQTGIYTAAFQLFVAPMTIIAMSLMTVLQPVVFVSNQVEFQRRMEQVASLLAILSMCYVLVLVFLGKEVFAVFFRHKADVDLSLIIVLALAGVANAYVQLQILAGKYTRGARTIFAAQIGAIVLVLLGNWLLLPKLGIMAAALTSLAACVLQIAVLRKIAAHEAQFAFFSWHSACCSITQLVQTMARWSRS